MRNPPGSVYAARVGGWPVCGAGVARIDVVALDVRRSEQAPIYGWVMDFENRFTTSTPAMISPKPRRAAVSRL